MTWRRGVNKLWKVVELHHFPHDFPHGKLANFGVPVFGKSHIENKENSIGHTEIWLLAEEPGELRRNNIDIP
jgi:hypothetical protein